MKVVWSDEAAWALVTLETRLAQRYSPDRAARIIEAFAVSIGCKLIHSSVVSSLNTHSGNCVS
jgi:hypothetical protein